MLSKRIQSAITLTLLALSAQADDRHTNPQKQVWKRQADQLKSQADAQTERATVLRAQAKALRKTEEADRVACDSANLVMKKNHQIQKKAQNKQKKLLAAQAKECAIAAASTTIKLVKPVDFVTPASCINLDKFTGRFDMDLKEAQIDLALKREERIALTKKIEGAERIHVKMLGKDTRYVKLGASIDVDFAKRAKVITEEAILKDKVANLSTSARVQKEQWKNCFAQTIRDTKIYQDKMLRWEEQESKKAACAASKNERAIVVIKPSLMRCKLHGVGFSLETEAKAADEQAAKYMNDYKMKMLEVTGKAEEKVVKSVDTTTVNRWAVIDETEVNKMAEAKHEEWHDLYRGTAMDQTAHQDMHADMARDAKLKRDAACNALSEAKTERAGLRKHQQSASAIRDSLYSFAAEKKLMVDSRKITSKVQEDDCRAKQNAAKYANKQAEKLALPKRKWDCNNNYCTMKTVDVILSNMPQCDRWTEERAVSWRTEASVATKDARDLQKTIVQMNAKIVAFTSIIKKLNRSCVVTTQAYNAADIRQNQDWSVTQASMNLSEMQSITETAWLKWSRESKAMMKKEMSMSQSEAVSTNVNFQMAQEAAKKAVEQMKVDVALLTNIEFKKLASEKYDTVYEGSATQISAIEAELEAKQVERQWRQAYKSYQQAKETQAKAEKHTAFQLNQQRLAIKAADDKEAVRIYEEAQKAKISVFQGQIGSISASAKSNAESKMLEYTRDSQSDVAFEIAERERLASAAVNTSAFEAKLRAAMELQRVNANKDKIRWNTSFNLPASDFTVSTKGGSSSSSSSSSSSVSAACAACKGACDGCATFVAPPAWWTQMVLDQKSGSASQASASSASSSSSSSSSSGASSSIDMGWTTADPNNASVWKGPGMWKGWDSNQKGFHSANIAGTVVETKVVTEPTPVAKPAAKPAAKPKAHHTRTSHNSGM